MRMPLGRLSVLLLLFLISLGGVSAIVVTQTEVAAIESPAAEHVDQNELRQLVASGRRHEAFEAAFDGGDELFEVAFNALDGVGANVGQGQRFTSVPRADLRGPSEWMSHQPVRFTGPNASSCVSCHSKPFDDGAGDPSTAVHRDPLRSGNLAQFIQRDTPPLFGMGALQRLAEEMTESLQGQREQLRRMLCDRGGTSSVTLSAKGVGFGTLSGTRTRANPCTVTFNTDGVRGVDFEGSAPDLVVKPFQWKGVVASLRAFVRDASHNELGMQAVEIAGDRVDGDFDGVADELTIGDVTAMSVYLAAQPRPTTLTELASLGLIEPLPQSQRSAIQRGRTVFNRQTAGTFMTRALWGVGSTAPYMHDGRATTLVEAILEHATGNANDPSEASPSRRRYLALSTADQQALIAFLNNLVLFKIEEQDG